MFVAIWLKRYFDKFGDSLPNRQEVTLLVMAMKDVYKQYSNETHNVHLNPIDYCTFVALWNTLYPRYVNRPWCDIPGKYIFNLYFIFHLLIS
jgi:hypothetical protein